MEDTAVGDAIESATTPTETDEATTEALFARHHLALIRLAVHLVDELGAAEDVVQDVFASLSRRRGEPPVTISYLQTAVINRSRSVLRHRRVVRSLWLPVAPHAEAADSGALAGERQREVLAAVRALPQRQREVVVLRFYQDLDTRAIATVLATSQTSVTSALSRAMTSLSHLLTRDGDTDA